jgi:hypothetical protein
MTTPTRYAGGLIGTPELADILGLLERAEGFGNTSRGLGNIYDDSSPGNTNGKANGKPTIGYGFNLCDPNTLAAVLDGLTFTVGPSTGNVFVLGAAAAPAAGKTVESATDVAAYFS